MKRARKQLRQLESGDRVGEPFSVYYVVPCYSGPKSKRRGEEILTRLADDRRRQGMATATHLATTGEITDVENAVPHVYPGVLLVAKQVQWHEA